MTAVVWRRMDFKIVHYDTDEDAISPSRTRQEEYAFGVADGNKITLFE